MANNWIDTLAGIMGVLPNGIVRLGYMSVLAAASLLLFLVVCAHGVKPDSDEGGKDRPL